MWNVVLRIHQSPHHRPSAAEDGPTARRARLSAPIALPVARVIQKVRRRGAVVVQPVRGDRSQQPITVDRATTAFMAQIRPFLKLLQDPRQLSNRGVFKSVTDCGWTALLQRDVAEPFSYEVVHPLNEWALRLVELGRVHRHAGETEHRCRGQHVGYHVHADHVRRVTDRHVLGHAGAYVTTGDAVALVTEPVHGLDERPGHPDRCPAMLPYRR